MYLIVKIFLFCALAYSSISKEEFKSNSKLELLIEEYLLNNPEIIIKSLENYRKKQEAKIEKELEYFINDYYEKKIYETLPYTGNTSAQIIVTEFIDYNCGYCKKTLQVINELLKRNNNIKVVFIDFPILSETSYTAARAALAAFEQDAYFEFHTELLTGNRGFSESYIIDLAKKLKLDINKFKEDMESSLVSEKLEKNIKFARDLNIKGTPSFIIKKKVHPGAYDLKKLEEIIKNN